MIEFSPVTEPKPTTAIKDDDHGRSKLDEFQRQDLRIKWLTLLVTLLGFAGTILTIYIQFASFINQQKAQQVASTEQANNAEKARAQEYQKQFWQKQLDFFSEACQTTGALTYAPVNSPEFNQAHAKFEELYWGRLAIVESDDVASQMVAFRNALNSLVSAKSDDEQAKARETLQDISLDLAHKCRETVAASFKVELKALPLPELKKHEKELKEHEEAH
jgi:hypothetical protein